MLRLYGLSRHIARALRIATLTEEATQRLAVFGHHLPCREAHKRRFGSAGTQWQEVVAAKDVALEGNPAATVQTTTRDFAKTLPIVCPGCGGMSQTVDAEVAGFYSPKKRNLQRKREEAKQDEDRIFEQAMARLSADEQTLPATPEAEPADIDKPLLCDRCHDLIHQSKGQSILHPSMESIREIIESSPHRDNHIYHVLDAADFPMSLIPNLISTLDLPRLRTQNRRSKSKQYIRGRTADISFIITRSDLLAPRKEDVDRLMPYLQEVLRDALGRAGKNLRLGNVRCVSAKRGWWTPQVKEEIWKRGGAGWVVGKVNVGKSALFEVVYPKGRGVKPDAQVKLDKVRQRGALNQPAVDRVTTRDQPDDAGIGDSMLDAAESWLDALEQQPSSSGGMMSNQGKQDTQVQAPDRGFDVSSADSTGGFQSHSPTEQPFIEEETAEDDEDAELSLLPPAQQETAYPHMPIVSSLPGTTASPIRIPFGNGKGELIDLPGVQRSSMETHIRPEHRSSLVMKSRIVPEQITLHAGRSLLLGGIIRITPKTEDLTFLVYPFTPLTPHAARTDKTIAIQTGFNEDGTPYDGTIENIGTDSAKKRIKRAGTFKIEWDATSKRTGSLTDRTAGKRKVDDLPFIVYSADILIEGVGWVEIACQVRSRKKSLLSDAFSQQMGVDVESKKHDDMPEIEVFSPKGKFIGIRRPMNAYITGGPKKVAKHAVKKRPRMSISYQKRMEGGRRGS
ncbi:putative P-loop containing nucleoside triphosphate hydrolase [Septoria linicola]|nr:putative P-loop containing nucleoside triphosphate hydrolase [Septoria linicola]